MIFGLLHLPEGWLALFGFLVAAEAAASSIAAAKWQPGLEGLPLLAALALLVAYVISHLPKPHLRWHVVAIVGGYLVSVHMVAGSFLPAGIGWISRTGTVTARLVDWIDQSIMVRIYQDDLLVALAVAFFVYAWTYLTYWLALPSRQGWLASALLGISIFGNVEFKATTASPYLTIWSLGCLLLILRVALGYGDASTFSSASPAGGLGSGWRYWWTDHRRGGGL